MRQKIDCLAVRVCAAFIFLLISGSLLAQKKVSGTVTNAKDKQPLAFASVTVKGTNIATVTTTSGAFVINVPSNKNTLVVSSIGFDDVEIDVSSRDNVEVSLKEKASSLDEIVVTGYTAQKKKSITGSVATVNVKDLKSVPAGSPAQMLQGRASGLTVINPGQPGSSSLIRVRGITSFGGADPLVMIDGTQGDINNVNADDIESISVLKDAGAAAIYGVRGSAGVILITTKRGKGLSKITYDSYYGTQQPLQGNVYNLLNTQEMADVTWLALRNSNQVGSNGNPVSAQYGNGASPVIPDYIVAGTATGVIGVDNPVANPDLYNVDYNAGPIYQITPANKQGTDWYHTLFTPAPIQSHTISASGANDKSAYLFSLGYFNQQGTLLNTYLKRYSARINTVFNVKNNIRIGENAYLFYKDNPQIGLNQENDINQVYRMQPIIPVFDIKGGFGSSRGTGLGNSRTPYGARTRAADDKGNTWDITGNVFGEVDFLKHFTARTQFGGTIDNGYYYNYQFHQYENAENNGSNGFSENAFFNRTWQWTNTLTYSNVFAQKHSVKALFGSEALSFYGRGVGGQRLGYFTDAVDYRNLSNGSPTGQTNYSYAYQSTLFSYIAQIDYGYDDKYFVGLRGRRDQASVFGPDNRTGYFPAVSAAWRVSREKFMSGVSWINELKIKGSWGKLGSYSNVPSENQYTLFGGGPGDAYYDINGTSTSIVQGFRATRIGSPVTGWEEDKLTNVGFEAVLFKNKFDFSFEWYKKAISGLLFQDQQGIIASGGATLPQINIGNIENTGVDMSAGYHGTVSKDFKFDITGTFTTYNAIVKEIPGQYFEAAGTRIGNFVRNQTGQAIGAFYGYKVLGLFQDAADVSKSPTQDQAAPGRFKYQDVNNDGKITSDDRTFFGDPNPAFTYGLNLSAAYKGFDFSMFLYGSQGNDAINYVKYWTDFFPAFQGAKSKDLLYNSWSPSNPNAKTPIAENEANFSNDGVPNSYYLEDASYLRCKQISIGYSLPQSVLQRFKVDKFRIYVQAANLFTITNYSGADPEIGGSNTAFGVDFGVYPNNQKTYLVGLNVSF